MKNKPTTKENLGVEKENIIKELEKAEQQILGFYHCYNGGDIRGLCSAMNLTKNEYKLMLSKKMLNYLPEELKKEIIDYLK